jgi:LPPG:FO 2-phospho-L-lactate transferase
MSAPAPSAGSYVVLSGGSGGVKLAVGLARLLGERLSVIVNTGDDFTHLGLHISPDVDTVLYSLAGRVNDQTGWGRHGETWTFMHALGELGGATWFKLGDGDLATHVDRTQRLGAGETLTAVGARQAAALGIAARILPMSDDPVRTTVETDAGTLSFQEYFVRDQCRPVVRQVRLEGVAQARPTAEVVAVLSATDLAGIIIGPSNPWLSVDPILAVPGMREALRASGAPVIAVSPIIAGKAVKGPTAKIMAELALRPDSRTVAGHYEGLIDGFVIDREDQALENDLHVPVLVTNTMMRSLEDRIALARQCLAFCGRLAPNVTRAGSKRLSRAGS